MQSLFDENDPFGLGTGTTANPKGNTISILNEDDPFGLYQQELQSTDTTQHDTDDPYGLGSDPFGLFETEATTQQGMPQQSVEQTPEQIREQQAANVEMRGGGTISDIKQRFTARPRMNEIERGISIGLATGNQEKVDELVKIRKQVMKLQEEGAKEDTSGFFGQLADVIGYMYDNFKNSIPDVVAGAGAGAAAGAIGGPLAGATALGGAGVGLGVGQWRNSAMQGAGMIYADLLDQGIKPEVAKNVALGGGAVYGLVEQLFKVVPKPLQVAMVKPLERYMARKLGSAALRMAGKYAANVAGEVAEEGIQQGIGDYAYKISRELQQEIAEDGSPLAEITNSEMWNNALEASRQALLPVMALGAVPAGFQVDKARRYIGKVTEAETKLGLTEEQAQQRFATASDGAIFGAPAMTPEQAKTYLAGLNIDIEKQAQAKEAAEVAATEAESKRMAEEEVAKVNANDEIIKRMVIDPASVTPDEIKQAFEGEPPTDDAGNVLPPDQLAEVYGVKKDWEAARKADAVAKTAKATKDFEARLAPVQAAWADIKDETKKPAVINALVEEGKKLGLKPTEAKAIVNKALGLEKPTEAPNTLEQILEEAKKAPAPGPAPSKTTKKATIAPESIPTTPPTGEAAKLASETTPPVAPKPTSLEAVRARKAAFKAEMEAKFPGLTNADGKLIQPLVNKAGKELGLERGTDSFEVYAGKIAAERARRAALPPAPPVPEPAVVKVEEPVKPEVEPEVAPEAPPKVEENEFDRLVRENKENALAEKAAKEAAAKEVVTIKDRSGVERQYSIGTELFTDDGQSVKVTRVGKTKTGKPQAWIMIDGKEEVVLGGKNLRTKEQVDADTAKEDAIVTRLQYPDDILSEILPQTDRQVRIEPIQKALNLSRAEVLPLLRKAGFSVAGRGMVSKGLQVDIERAVGEAGKLVEAGGIDVVSGDIRAENMPRMQRLEKRVEIYKSNTATKAEKDAALEQIKAIRSEVADEEAARQPAKSRVGAEDIQGLEDLRLQQSTESKPIGREQVLSNVAESAKTMGGKWTPITTTTTGPKAQEGTIKVNIDGALHTIYVVLDEGLNARGSYEPLGPTTHRVTYNPKLADDTTVRHEMLGEMAGELIRLNMRQPYKAQIEKALGFKFDTIKDIHNFFATKMETPEGARQVVEQLRNAPLAARDGFRGFINKVIRLFNKFTGANISELTDANWGKVAEAIGSGKLQKVFEYAGGMARMPESTAPRQSAIQAEARFKELTKTWTPGGDWQAWKSEHPKEYAELEKMRADRLKEQGSKEFALNVKEAKDEDGDNVLLVDLGDYQITLSYPSQWNGYKSMLHFYPTGMPNTVDTATGTYRSGLRQDLLMASRRLSYEATQRGWTVGLGNNEAQRARIYSKVDITSSAKVMPDDTGRIPSPSEWGNEKSADIRFQPSPVKPIEWYKDPEYKKFIAEERAAGKYISPSKPGYERWKASKEEAAQFPTTIHTNEGRDVVKNLTGVLDESLKQADKLGRKAPPSGTTGSFVKSLGRTTWSFGTFLPRKARELWSKHNSRSIERESEVKVNILTSLLESDESKKIQEKAKVWDKEDVAGIGSITGGKKVSLYMLAEHLLAKRLIQWVDSGKSVEDFLDTLKNDKGEWLPQYEHIKSALIPLIKNKATGKYDINAKTIGFTDDDSKLAMPSMSIRELSKISLKPNQEAYRNILRDAYDKAYEYADKEFFASHGKHLGKYDFYVPLTRDITKAGQQSGRLTRMIEEDMRNRTIESKITGLLDVDPDSIEGRSYNNLPFMLREAGDAIEDHVQNVARYYGFNEYFSVWKNLIGRGKAHENLVRQYGSDYVKQMREMLDAQEGVMSPDPANPANKLIKAGMNRATTAALMNLTIPLYQGAAATNAMVKYGTPSFLKAVSAMMTPEGRKIANDIWEKSYTAVWRRSRAALDPGVVETKARAANIYRTGGKGQLSGRRFQGFQERFIRGALTPISAMDSYAQKLIMLTAYYNAQADGKPIDYKAIAEDGNSVINDMQSTVDPTNQIGLKLSKQLLPKMMTMLASETAAIYNTILRSAKDSAEDLALWRKGDVAAGERFKNDSMKKMLRVAAMVALTNAWIALVKTGRDELFYTKKDEEEGKEDEEFQVRFANRMLEGITGLVPAPNLSSPAILWAIHTMKGDDKKAAKYSYALDNWGSLATQVPRGVLGIFQNLSRMNKAKNMADGMSPKQAARMMEYATKGGYKSLGMALEGMTGIGLSQYKATLEGIFDKIR